MPSKSAEAIARKREREAERKRAARAAAAAAQGRDGKHGGARIAAPPCPACAGTGRYHDCAEFPLPAWSADYLRTFDRALTTTLPPLSLVTALRGEERNGPERVRPERPAMQGICRAVSTPSRGPLSGLERVAIPRELPVPEGWSPVPQTTGLDRPRWVGAPYVEEDRTTFTRHVLPRDVRPRSFRSLDPAIRATAVQCPELGFALYLRPADGMPAVALYHGGRDRPEKRKGRKGTPTLPVVTDADVARIKSGTHDVPDVRPEERAAQDADVILRRWGGRSIRSR